MKSERERNREREGERDRGRKIERVLPTTGGKS